MTKVGFCVHSEGVFGLRNGEIEFINVARFKENDSLGCGRTLVVQLKGFNRGERVRRQIKQGRKSRLGSKSERPISPGAILVFSEIPPDGVLLEERATFGLDIPDSRGMVYDPKNGRLLVASVNEIYCLSGLTQVELTPGVEFIPEVGILPIFDPYFGFIHSLDISPDGRRVLVTSSGFDRIMEFDLVGGRKVREWIAVEHGYQPEIEPEEYWQRVEESKGKGLGLPPGLRAAFPNSAIYIDENTILATLFHSGQLVRIDLNTGKTEVVLDGLLYPYSVLRLPEGGYVVTNTGAGEALLLDENFKVRERLAFWLLEGEDPEAEGRQWLQHVRPVRLSQGNGKVGGQFLAVDSHRTAVFLVDKVRKVRRKISYPTNWVVQEAMVL